MWECDFVTMNVCVSIDNIHRRIMSLCVCVCVCLYVVTVTILPYTPFKHALVTGLDIHLLATHCFLNVNSLTLS